MARACTVFPSYVDYQSRTRRRIPLLLLEPADGRVLEETARLLTLFLSDPQARLPTFPRMGMAEYRFPVAVKTGTSQAYRDNWTIGYTRDVTVGVWERGAGETLSSGTGACAAYSMPPGFPSR